MTLVIETSNDRLAFKYDFSEFPRLYLFVRSIPFLSKFKKLKLNGGYEGVIQADGLSDKAIGVFRNILMIDDFSSDEDFTVESRVDLNQLSEIRFDEILNKELTMDKLTADLASEEELTVLDSEEEEPTPSTQNEDIHDDSIDEDMTNLIQAYKEIEEKLQSLSSEHDELVDNYGELNLNYDELTKNHDALVEEKKIFVDKITMLENDNVVLQNKVKASIIKNDNLSQKLEELTSRYNYIRSEIHKVGVELHGKKR